jgi:hypothetical protein
MIIRDFNLEQIVEPLYLNLIHGIKHVKVVFFNMLNLAFPNMQEELKSQFVMYGTCQSRKYAPESEDSALIFVNNMISPAMKTICLVSGCTFRNKGQTGIV